MSEISNNKQLDFYRNQINQNQNNQANIFLRENRKEVSFIVIKNFLEFTFNKFLYDNLQRIQQFDPNNQSIVNENKNQQIDNICKIWNNKNSKNIESIK